MSVVVRSFVVVIHRCRCSLTFSVVASRGWERGVGVVGVWTGADGSVDGSWESGVEMGDDNCDPQPR